MTAQKSSWDDLAMRARAAVAMVVIGLAGIAAGGHVFHVLVAIICGVMVWELVGMLQPGSKGQRQALGVFTGAVVFAAIYMPVAIGLSSLLVPAVIGFFFLSQNKRIYIVFSTLILGAGYGMMQVRDDLGFAWLFWLVLVVVMTDVAGYFAGRLIGGPKFWPAISPKKTWSGTAAGWLGAAVVGFFFSPGAEVAIQMMVISVLVSMASQAGDIAESAVKRKMGVKDSSNLIPGHGGLMDRFDGMLGASLFLLVLGQFIGFPPDLEAFNPGP